MQVPLHTGSNSLILEANLKLECLADRAGDLSNRVAILSGRVWPGIAQALDLLRGKV